MTELSFLIDLLLNHRLPPKTKEHVALRIKEVEESFTNKLSPAFKASPNFLPPTVGNQAPSMQAVMARNPDLVPAAPVAVIAQTPTTATAMADRAAAIAAAASGIADKATGGHKKYRNL